MRDGSANGRRRRATLRRVGALGLGALGLSLAACGAPVRPDGAVTGAGALALLGVGVAPGVDAGGGRTALDALAASAFERAGTHRFEPPATVRTEIDPDRLDTVLDAFGRTGALVPAELQSLMAAPIGHRRALLLRLEENVVERLDPVARTVAERPNERRIVQAVRRRVRVAGTEIDLNRGSVRPLGSWTTAAEARTEHRSEGGDGFVASVAATLAGRMAGRPGAPPPPEPPPTETALQVVFEEIARELPRS